VLSSPKIFADDTTLPVLDPGRGKTKTGYLWCYAVDDRPWCGPSNPAVAYIYTVRFIDILSPDRVGCGFDGQRFALPTTPTATAAAPGKDCLCCIGIRIVRKPGALAGSSYFAVRDAGAACRRFGISRPTLRKWLAARIIGGTQEALILELRRERRLGIKRLRNELQRLHGLRLSAATIRADAARGQRPADAKAEPSQAEAIQPPGARRSGADGHMQDRVWPLPIRGD
jgi:hypothetical protein